MDHREKGDREMTTERVFCGGCGSSLSAEARFCGDCGASQLEVADVAGSEAETVFARSPGPDHPAPASPSARETPQATPGELAGQLVVHLSTPGVAFACITALAALGAMAASGLLAAIVSPDRSIVGGYSADSGILEESLRLMVGCTLARLEVGSGSFTLTPVLFVLAPVLGALAGALAQADRLAGLPTRERLAWGAGAGLPLAVACTILSLVAGGDIGAQSADFDAGSVLLYSLLWGTMGGLAGSAVAIRRTNRSALAGVLPQAVRHWAALVTVPLRALALALVVTSAVGLAVWEIQSLKGEESATGGRSTGTAMVENLAFTGEFGLGAMGLATFAKFDPAQGRGYSLPISDGTDVEDAEHFTEDFRLLDYRHVYPVYVFVPLLLVLAGALLLLMLYGGFATARSMAAPTPTLGAAYGAAVGAVWSIALVTIRAIMGGSALDGESLFVSVLLVGTAVGAIGGLLSSSSGSSLARV